MLRIGWRNFGRYFSVRRVNPINFEHLMVNTDLRVLKTIKEIIKEEDKNAMLLLNVIFYGSLVIAILSGIIKFILK